MDTTRIKYKNGHSTMVSYLTEDEVDEEFIPTFMSRPKQNQVLQETSPLRKRFVAPIVSNKVSWTEKESSSSESEEEIVEDPETSSMTSCTMFLFCTLVLSLSIVPPLVISLTR
jgi:hypothetical protein